MFRRPDRPEEVIEMIRTGDEQLRNRFITDSVPEIRHWIRRITRSIFANNEDEFAIALEGFNEAIDRYRADSQVPFYCYARMIVKHRLYDWMRYQKKHKNTLVFTDCDTDRGIPIEDRLADPGSDTFVRKIEINESLLQLDAQLELFGFKLSELTEHFPKHRDSQLFCITAAHHLSEDDTLFKQLMNSHRLPGSELARRCKVSVKTVEKNRSSIVLLTLLLRSDLQIIRSYIAAFERREG